MMNDSFIANHQPHELYELPRLQSESRGLESHHKVTENAWIIDVKPFPTLAPGLKTSTKLWLTVLYIALYGLLFVFVYCQLWMIWYYRHKRLSYQTVFLFLCLVWTGLRTTLFAFYFDDYTVANNMPIFPYWLLFCFPVCLQFITLCLLVLFFAQVVFKARAKYEPSRYKCPLRMVLGGVGLVFLTTNITVAVLTKIEENEHRSVHVYLLMIRVGINDTLFLLAAIVLSLCIYKMRKMPSSHVILEAKGTTVCQALTVSILIVLLFASRAIYNLLAICQPLKKHLPSFGYNWINVSDQADAVDLGKGYAYVSFGIVLFIWEILPTFVIVLFFRVRKPVLGSTLNDMASHTQSSRSYFFDNPRRYDSDDDLTRNDLQRSIGDFNRSYQSINHIPSQGSTPRGTPRGTPKLYGSNYSVSGSYGREGGGQGSPFTA